MFPGFKWSNRQQWVDGTWYCQHPNHNFTLKYLCLYRCNLHVTQSSSLRVATLMCGVWPNLLHTTVTLIAPFSSTDLTRGRGPRICPNLIPSCQLAAGVVLENARIPGAQKHVTCTNCLLLDKLCATLGSFGEGGGVKRTSGDGSDRDGAPGQVTSTNASSPATFTWAQHQVPPHSCLILDGWQSSWCRRDVSVLHSY